jgi:hypothetical protein
VSAVARDVQQRLYEYAAALAQLAEWREIEQDLLAPGTTRWSSLSARAQVGRPTDPTGHRAERMAALHARMARAERVVASIQPWWCGLAEPDRTFLAHVYGIEAPRMGLVKAARKAGRDMTARAARAWLVRLLLGAARAWGLEPLGSPGWLQAYREVLAVAAEA